MLEMILRMSAATAIYVALTMLVWRIWTRRSHSLLMRVLIGVFFGLCSVVSTHIGVNYGDMVLNVRDIGPLSAGLFFSPLSGLIAGVIGGVERFIAGEFWGVGSYTRVACSLSTILAGLLAAVLNRWVYKGERPSVPHAFSLGAVMEVFHMYAVFFTHQNDMITASYVVRTVSVPMILFTALGVALCSLIIKFRTTPKSERTWRQPEERRPLSTRFQRWLFLVTISVFCANAVITYSLETRSADQEASVSLQLAMMDHQHFYEEIQDIDTLDRVMQSEIMNVSLPICFLILESDMATVYSSSMDLHQSAVLSVADRESLERHMGAKPFITNLDALYGEEFLAVVAPLGRRYLFLGTDTSTMYYNRDNKLLEDLLSDILIFTVLFILISLLVESLVVDKLASVNASLARITAGKLDETVSVRSSAEFTDLSDDINRTVTALRGYIDAAEKRMEEELTLAATIQEAALPRNFDFPRNDFEIYALMTPARHVGGDFYDFFFIDADHLALVIADVSGKGIPAALFMMRSKTAIKTFARSGYTPSKLLAQVNRILCEGNDAEMFVTAWIGIIDLKTGKMLCANAGHEYPVVMRAGEEYSVLKDRHGLVLAALEIVTAKDYEIAMKPGDRIFVYTDGVPEAINTAEEAYGLDRLVSTLNTLRDQPEERVLKGTLEDIRSFADGAEQFDDITMIGFTYRGPEGSSEKQS